MDETIRNYLYIVCVALGIYLVLYLVMKINIALIRKDTQKQITAYKDMLAHRMEIENSGLDKIKKECESLRKENENLRITVQAYSQKPGRRELQRLNIYQSAIDNLLTNTPGFGTAWQVALKNSEDEFAKTDSGILPFIRKLIPMKASTAEVVETDNGK